MAATTFKFGDITIHRVVEREGPFFNPLEFFPSLTPEVLEENRGWMTEGGYLDRQSGQLVLCIQAYLVQTPHHNILIDSCVGNGIITHLAFYSGWPASVTARRITAEVYEERGLT
jgi:hypothetical protein